MNKSIRKTVVVAATLIAALLLFGGCVGVPPLTDGELSKRLEFNCKFDIMEAGQSRRYFVRIKPDGSIDDVEFDSSDPSVAEVAADGVVTARAAGKTTIKAMSSKTGFSDSFELTVYDAVIVSDGSETPSERLAELALSEGGKSVAISGDFSMPVSVNCHLTLAALSDAKLCDTVVESGASLVAEGVTFRQCGKAAAVVVEEGAAFAALRCAFACDPSAKETAACEADEGFCSLMLDECGFAGFECGVNICPSDAKIEIEGNIFARCKTAVKIDAVLPGESKNAKMRGTVGGNIFSGCDETVRLNAFGDVVESLKTDDA